MEGGSVWKDIFEKWPSEMDRQGVLVTSYEEQIPFDNFLTSEAFLLIERRTPDTLGARRIIIPYGNVVALKLTEVTKSRAFQALGFQLPAAKK